MIQEVIKKYGGDKSRLMDILMEIQETEGCVSSKSAATVAEQLGISKVDVEQTLSFYHFFSSEPRGKYTVYLNESAVAGMMGAHEVAHAFEKETGVKFGSVTNDGQIGLFYTADIGMNDQEPAALINGQVFTHLNAEKVKQLVAEIKAGKAVDQMITNYGDGNNAAMKAMVKNNIMKKGSVIFTDYTTGTALKKVVTMDPNAVIDEVKKSNLRGRGGAGFSTGMKWDFCSKSQGDVKYVLCNADEGEPGTFKDRALLTELSERMFEGMAVGGYAIGAKLGVLYLRGEYRYMKAHLENVLEGMRGKNLLGKNIAGKAGFDFDIRIQMGAGAYVCGEESALIESAEGKRGEPRNRPPFPVQKGYLQKPTIVNNVETYCAVSKIMEKGADWYKNIGTKDSAGTKVLSISGDCKNPGIYEIEWGMSIKDMIEMAGGEVAKTQAVQVAGPSGVCLSPNSFDRKIAFEDLPTGGSMIIIGTQRDLLKDVVLNFMKFMVDESCGSCVPCRGFNVLLTQKLEKVIAGNGIKSDLAEMESWGKMLSMSTRCGLGQTSSNPITSTLLNFREKYEALVKDVEYASEFDMAASVAESCEYVNRKPNIH